MWCKFFTLLLETIQRKRGNAQRNLEKIPLVQLEQWFPKCGRRIPRSSTRCQETRGYISV